MSTQGSQEQQVQKIPPYEEWDADQLRGALDDNYDDLAELTPWRDGANPTGVTALREVSQADTAGQLLASGGTDPGSQAHEALPHDAQGCSSDEVSGVIPPDVRVRLDQHHQEAAENRKTQPQRVLPADYRATAIYVNGRGGPSHSPRP